MAVPFGLILRLPDGTPVSETLWLSMDDDVGCGTCGTNAQVYGPVAGGGGLKCGEDECAIAATHYKPFAFWPYLEAEASGGYATYYARFGGHGTLALQLEASDEPANDCLSCGGYVGITCITARSTDFDADGNTDQDEKTTLHTCMTANNCPIDYDLDGNGSVGPADYIIVAEEQKRLQDNPVAMQKCVPCSGQDWPCGTVAMNNLASFDSDPGAPDTTKMAKGSVSGCNVTIRWRSPGDDLVSGSKRGVPKEYDLRYSSSPITTGNFASATRYTSTPTPALALTLESVTVDPFASNGYYWAIKTKDAAGQWSSMSANLNLVAPIQITDLTACSVSKNCVLLGWTAPTNGIFYDVVRYSTSSITNCNVESATAGPAVPTPVNLGGHNEMFVEGLSQGTTYYFVLRAKESFTGPWSPISNVVQFTTPTTGPSCRTNVLCSGEATSLPLMGVPASLELSAPQPNPSEASTLLGFGIPSDRAGTRVVLGVFDLSGRRVATLYQGIARPGWQSIVWNLKDESGRQVRSGVYFARLDVEGEQLKQTIVVR